jgi:hypothetical protein
VLPKGFLASLPARWVQQGTIMKKLAWTALVTAVSTAAAYGAVRALELMWRRVTKEPPPPMPWWARFVVGKTTKAATPS